MDAEVAIDARQEKAGGLEFGAWVTGLRKSRDLTRDELASRVYCATPTLRKIETGERRPSKELASRLAIELGIPEEDRSAFVAFARRWPSPPSIGHPAKAEKTARESSRDEGRELPSIPRGILYGRDEDLEKLGVLLADRDRRLITLTGMGGVGKSRLALAAADAWRKREDQDPLIFAMSDLLSSDDVTSRFLETVEERPPFPSPRIPCEKSRQRPSLLLLDGADELPEAYDLVRKILSLNSKAKVICTSPAPLGLRSETVYRVRGLPLVPSISPGTLPAAIGYFLDRLGPLRAKSLLLPESLETIGDICLSLEGIPIAIEMAATWARDLPLDAVARLLREDPLALSMEARDLPARHRSLHSIIRTSWRLLGPQEREALSTLSRLEGEFSVEEAARVSRSPIPAILALLDGCFLVTRETGLLAVCGPIRHFARRACPSPGAGAAARDGGGEPLEFAKDGPGDSADEGAIEGTFLPEGDFDALRSVLGRALPPGNNQGLLEERLRLVPANEAVAEAAGQGAQALLDRCAK